MPIGPRRFEDLPPLERLEVMRREMARRGMVEPRYVEDLFAEQRAFVKDASRLKVAICGRRAGKSFVGGRYMVREAERRPGALCAYLALTRPSAKRIMWDDPVGGLPAINAQYQLGGRVNHTELTIVFENSSRLFVVGADDVKAIERLRGGRYALAIIDEAASFGASHLHGLIVDVLRPAMMDLRGTIAMVGSPGAACAGEFYDACVGVSPGWTVHHWTALNNPHVEDPAGYLAEERRLRGWTEEHPTYRREYLGEWVRDASGIVYPYLADRNAIDSLPADSVWQHVLGIDYGFGNATAFVILSYRPHDPCVYVSHSEKHTGMTPSRAAQRTREIESRWAGLVRIVGDVGGLGKGYAEEARQRFALPIEPATKTDKRGVQELLAGDLIAGRVKFVISRNKALIEQMSILQWNEDRSAEDDRFDNDLCDAMLYGWRATKAWLADHEDKERAPVTEENEEERMMEETWRRITEAKAGFDFGDY